MLPEENRQIGPSWDLGFILNSSPQKCRTWLRYYLSNIPTEEAKGKHCWSIARKNVYESKSLSKGGNNIINIF